MGEKCLACGGEGKTKAYVASPILPGWHGPMPVRVLKPFHPECYKSWYRENYRGLAELDQSLNECRYFERSPDDSASGHYVRDGLRLPCKQWWRGAEFMQAHREAIVAAGLESDWWKPRWDDDRG
jgi:hypothetical protein